MVKRITGERAIVAEKTVPISFRVTPRFKALLEIAAAKENRSLTNCIETLLFAYCEQHGITEPDQPSGQAKESV